MAIERLENVGILTAGGDCPGLNAVLRAFVKTAEQERELGGAQARTRRGSGRRARHPGDVEHRAGVHAGTVRGADPRAGAAIVAAASERRDGIP